MSGGNGLWLDHRNRVYCRLSGELSLAFLPLGPLSLASLPPLLLGRLPLAPADPASVESRPSRPATGTGGRTGSQETGAGVDISYRDAAGRRWTAALRDGQPLRWGLWPDGAGGPLLSWVSSGGWSVLSDTRKGAQVRWRQTVSEPLRLPPAAPGPAASAQPTAPAVPPAAPAAPSAPVAPAAPSGYREATCAAAPAGPPASSPP